MRLVYRLEHLKVDRLPPALRDGQNRRLLGAISSGGTFEFAGAARGIGACSSLELVRLEVLVVGVGVGSACRASSPESGFLRS